MEVEEIQAWLFQIEPLPRESLSHFLGRFRRSNDLTPGGLAGAAGFGGAIISRWEKFRFNPLLSLSRKHNPKRLRHNLFSTILTVELSIAK